MASKNIREVQLENAELCGLVAERWEEGPGFYTAPGFCTERMHLFEARGLALTDEARQRILGCRDLARLERWTRQALSIDSVEDLWSD